MYSSGAQSVLSFIGYIIEMAVMVFTVVSMWRMFEKGGEPGWKCLIPFYGVYIEFKLAGRQKLYWFMLGITLMTLVGFYVVMIPVIVALLSAGAYGVDMDALFSGEMMTLLILFGVMCLCSIAMFVIQLSKNISLGKAYGYFAGFAWGLPLLPVIFYGILGFGDCSYYGPMN